MSTAYAEELVFVETEDGLTHAGLINRPREKATKPLAIVWIHGFGVNFYYPGYIHVGRELVSRGFIFVCGNNRGRDFGYPTRNKKQNNKAVIQGAWWEYFADCVYDVAAWIDRAMEEQVRGVALIGHSYGTLKVTYYQAERQDERVRGLMLASPGLAPHDVELQPLELARQLVSNGQREALLPWGSVALPPGKLTISAQTYLHWGETFPDIFSYYSEDSAIAKIRNPILACYGTSDLGTQAELDALRLKATAASRIDTAIIEGADHGYYDHAQPVADLIERWVETLDEGRR